MKAMQDNTGSWKQKQIMTTQDVYLGILIATGGVASMFVGLPE